LAPASLLQELTCHVGSHSVPCHPGRMRDWVGLVGWRVCECSVWSTCVNWWNIATSLSSSLQSVSRPSCSSPSSAAVSLMSTSSKLLKVSLTLCLSVCLSVCLDTAAAAVSVWQTFTDLLPRSCVILTEWHATPSECVRANEVNSEDYQNCSELCCVQQLCTMTHIYTCEQFLVDCLFSFRCNSVLLLSLGSVFVYFIVSSLAHLVFIACVMLIFFDSS